MARKKKVITVRGSTNKKQAQKKKGMSQAQSLTVNVITGRRKSSSKVSVKAPTQKQPIIFNPIINVHPLMPPPPPLAKPENEKVSKITPSPEIARIPRIFQTEEPQYITFTPNASISKENILEKTIPVSDLTLPTFQNTISSKSQYEIEAISKPTKPNINLTIPIERKEIPMVSDLPIPIIAYEPVQELKQSPPSVSTILKSEQKTNKTGSNKVNQIISSRPTPAFEYPPFEESGNDYYMKPSINPIENEFISSGKSPLPPPSSKIDNLLFELNDFENIQSPTIEMTPIKRPPPGIQPSFEISEAETVPTPIYIQYDNPKSKPVLRVKPSSPPMTEGIDKAKTKTVIFDITPPEAKQTSIQNIPINIPSASRSSPPKLKIMPIEEEEVSKPPKSKITIPMVNIGDNLTIAGDLTIKKGKGRPIKIIANPDEADMKRLEKAQKERERYQKSKQQTPAQRAQIDLARLNKKAEKSQKRAADRNTKESNLDNFYNPPFEDEGV